MCGDMSCVQTRHVIKHVIKQEWHWH